MAEHRHLWEDSKRAEFVQSYRNVFLEFLDTCRHQRERSLLANTLLISFTGPKPMHYKPRPVVSLMDRMGNSVLPSTMKLG